jgi:2-polyprenyl-3-methyl-5-hydroxy-6-metoxy-1,4-benzoquinol methylase
MEVAGTESTAVEPPGQRDRLRLPTEAPRAKAAQGPLSWLARRGKLNYFLPKVPRDARILDVGCADNWLKRASAQRGWTGVVGIDFAPLSVSMA